MQRQARPRTWWLALLAILFGFALALVALLASALGFRMIVLSCFFAGVATFLVAAGSLAAYFSRQLAGRYRNLEARTWADLPW